MVSFECDYIKGAHPRVLEKLIQTNDEALPGYGADKYCESAKDKIKAACGREDAQVELLVGGTQTNAVVLSAILNDWEGVVAAETGHINTHEAGAIEYTGHKVLALEQTDGKINAETLKAYLDSFFADENHDHMVFPGAVYVTFPTEYGTLYSKAELTAISDVCRSRDIPLYLDGARMGYGLASKENDLTLNDIAELCDVFYIGGTKVGALCGEAVVFTHGNMPRSFMTSVKKRGALLAKGRLLGVQFDALFTDGLYFEISRHAIEMAEKLKDVFSEFNLTVYSQSPTNQQFLIMSDEFTEKLKQKLRFDFWKKSDDKNTVVRFATSWSTTDDDIEYLRNVLREIM